eukprot:2208463-Prymnesium_polylepis.1
MFSALEARYGSAGGPAGSSRPAVFTAVVGQKPSAAHFFLNDSDEVWRPSLRCARAPHPASAFVGRMSHSRSVCTGAGALPIAASPLDACQPQPQHGRPPAR